MFRVAYKLARDSRFHNKLFRVFRRRCSFVISFLLDLFCDEVVHIFQATTEIIIPRFLILFIQSVPENSAFLHVRIQFGI